MSTPEEIIAELQRDVAALKTENNGIQRSLSDSNPTSNSSSSFPKIKMKTPDTFDGSRDSSHNRIRNFISQCQLGIDNSPAFTEDEQKIRFTASYLRGDPYTWVSSYLELSDDEKSKDCNSWLTNWGEFKKRLHATFGDPDKDASDIRKLFAL
ncbi:hypothetical protein JCM16303_003412 [Sporobolomyces ruberrimus]